MSMKTEQKTKVKCIHKECGYEFETKSKLAQVTCPNCGKKTPRVSATRKVK